METGLAVTCQLQLQLCSEILKPGLFTYEDGSVQQRRYVAIVVERERERERVTRESIVIIRNCFNRLQCIDALTTALLLSSLHCVIWI